jgi:hypothetical protein
MTFLQKVMLRVRIREKALDFFRQSRKCSSYKFYYLPYLDIFRLPGSGLTTEKEIIQYLHVLTSFWFQQISFNSIKKQHAKKYLVAHAQG